MGGQLVRQTWEYDRPDALCATEIRRHRTFDAAFRRLNKPHEAIFCEGAVHPIDAVGNTAAVPADTMAHMLAFFRKYLTAR